MGTSEGATQYHSGSAPHAATHRYSEEDAGIVCSVAVCLECTRRHTYMYMYACTHIIHVLDRVQLSRALKKLPTSSTLPLPRALAMRSMYDRYRSEGRLCWSIGGTIQTGGYCI